MSKAPETKWKYKSKIRKLFQSAFKKFQRSDFACIQLKGFEKSQHIPKISPDIPLCNIFIKSGEYIHLVYILSKNLYLKTHICMIFKASAAFLYIAFFLSHQYVSAYLNLYLWSDRNALLIQLVFLLVIEMYYDMLVAISEMPSLKSISRYIYR